LHQKILPLSIIIVIVIVVMRFRLTLSGLLLAEFGLWRRVFFYLKEEVWQRRPAMATNSRDF
jgi:hypothetical protein